MTRPKLPETPLGPAGSDPGWDDIQWLDYGGNRYSMYYDRDNQPISLRQWVRGMENADYRWVKQTRVGDITVVTAWTGIDINCDLEKAPRIFGTIEIHGEEGTFHDEETDLTEADALATHDRRVAELRGRTDGRE